MTPTICSGGPTGDAAIRPDPRPATTGDKLLKREDHHLQLEYKVPATVEVILEHVTIISMSTTNDISNLVEFDEIETEPGHVPKSDKTMRSDETRYERRRCRRDGTALLPVFIGV
ncbi:hypothetical protein ACWEQ2_42200 [Streptomyces sp. NPDC004096]|uniref:hypothetical protein n=1 Tax=Streptomyces sp. NPDC057746 TaxID=3346237 RepID=UPI00367C806B